MTPAETRRVLLARVRTRDAEIIELILQADRAWWNPPRARQIRAKIRDLLDANAVDLAALVALGYPPPPRPARPRVFGYEAR